MPIRGKRIKCFLCRKLTKSNFVISSQNESKSRINAIKLENLRGCIYKIQNRITDIDESTPYFSYLSK